MNDRFAFSGYKSGAHLIDRNANWNGFIQVLVRFQKKNKISGSILWMVRVVINCFVAIKDFSKDNAS